MLRHVLTGFLALGLTAAVHGQRNKKLDVGDTAPGLDIEQWVKGDETTIESGKVYVVEFWATWCAPCRKSIPHLTELQKQFGDDGLTIIGVSTEETDVVEPFVKKQGKKMDYTVGVDRRNATSRAWMEAAEQQGIPCAFVVDRQGKLAFIGHPLDEEFPQVITGVLEGRYDPKLAKQAEPILKNARLERKVRNWRMAEKHYDEVIKVDPRVFAYVALEKFKMFAIDMKDRQRAYQYATDDLINKHFVDDPGAMGMLAEMIAADPELSPEMRDMDVALVAAESAQRLVGPHHHLALVTLAKIHYHRGEYEQAYRQQLEAWKVAKIKYKTEYKRTLDVYQAARDGAAVRSEG
jgi:thiol-disulfide isomerase/thioredoxin